MRDAALDNVHFFLPLALCFLHEAQMFLLAQHLRLCFLSILKNFMSSYYC